MGAVAAGAAIAYVLAERTTGLGFPLDDSWIHAQFARNLATGQGWAFNPGEPSAGSTSQLWSILLAIPIALGVDVIVSAKALGIALAVATAVFAFELTRSLSGTVTTAAAAGLAVALSPRLTWGGVSGMEVPLYTATACLTLLVFIRCDGRYGWIWGGLCGLAAMARPEVAVLMPILVAVGWWRRGTASTTSPQRDLAFALGAFCVVIGVSVTLNMAASGRPLPGTFYAKTGDTGLMNAVLRFDIPELWQSVTSRPFGALNMVTRYMIEQSAVMFLFIAPGLLAVLGLLRDRRAAAGIAVALVLLVSPLAMGMLAPVSPIVTQEGRYIAHLLVLFFIVSIVGAQELARRVRYPIVVWAFVVLAIARLLSQNVAFTDRYVAQVDNINQLHIEMAHWIAERTPPDAVIAANDIGAIGYFSNRRIVDLEGLVTPEILPYRRQRRHVEFLERVRPNLLVVFPQWYPHIVERTDLFREIYRLSIPRVTAAHSDLVVYETPWRGSTDTGPLDLGPAPE